MLDVHAELLDLYLEDRYSDQDRLFEDATVPHEVYTPLLARGWSHSIKTDGTQTFLAPEGLGSLRHRYATTHSDGPTWRAWAGYPSEPNWQARFSSGAPTTLAAAFTASLISTEPLHRAVQDVPFYTVVTATSHQLQPSSRPAIRRPLYRPRRTPSGRTR
ncbi:DUF317 domain-containing protein [Streptomyces sp. NBC_01003]|uniref:DUF317 domain-containing protein n=1 Tax=Streptomyces sp. NBC_01003 TaxID=2903714 RepID=UPI00386C2744|nr:DUF317 domain-containing protein [Streptomyces sp. NBC_01003]